jgi:hypothetical protein
MYIHKILYFILLLAMALNIKYSRHFINFFLLLPRPLTCTIITRNKIIFFYFTITIIIRLEYFCTTASQ